MIKKYTGKLPPKGAKGLEVVACINDFMHYFVDVVEQINKLSQEPKEKMTVVEYDDSKLKQAIADVAKRIPNGYDDSELKRSINLLDSGVRTAVETLDAERKALMQTLGNVKEYDDSEIKREIKSVADKIPKAYDDSQVLKTIEQVKKSIPVAFDSKPIYRELEQIKKSIPTAYNDSELKKLIKNQGEEIKKLNALIEKMRNDSQIKQLSDRIKQLETKLEGFI